MHSLGCKASEKTDNAWLLSYHVLVWSRMDLHNRHQLFQMPVVKTVISIWVMGPSSDCLSSWSNDVDIQHKPWLHFAPSAFLLQSRNDFLTQLELTPAPWPNLSCVSIMTSLVTGWSFGSRMGCLVSYESSSAKHKRPSIRSNPSPSLLGFS